MLAGMVWSVFVFTCMQAKSPTADSLKEEPPPVADVCPLSSHPPPTSLPSSTTTASKKPFGKCVCVHLPLLLSSHSLSLPLPVLLSYPSIHPPPSPPFLSSSERGPHLSQPHDCVDRVSHWSELASFPTRTLGDQRQNLLFWEGRFEPS